jgi:predicted AAA+ superfamily ATPase
MDRTYLAREIGGSLLRALEDFPVVVITGPRQTGKTTLLRRDPALAHRRYVTLDEFAYLEAARRDPEALVRGDEPLTIDEAQRCPELLLAIKAEVDRHRKPGRFLLSGSAQFGLLKGVSESLAGRAMYLHLHAFSPREMAGTIKQRPLLLDLFDGKAPSHASVKSISPLEVVTGGMPSVCLGQVKDAAAWFKAYEQTYLERDVRELAQVGDLIPFRNFLHLAALRTGQILNLSELARDAKMTVLTAGRYLSVLEASFLLRRLPPYLRNRASRVVKSAKLHVADSGLAAHLCAVSDIGPQSDEPLRGALYETYVAQNLTSIVEAHWPSAQLAYWNVQGRHEVDFVVEAGRDSLAIEVKAASRFDERDLAGLRAFLRATPRCRSAVLAYNGAIAASLEDRLWAIPMRALLG